MTVLRETTGNETRVIWYRDRRVQITAAVVVLLVALLVWKACHKSSSEEEAGNVVVSVQVAKAERTTIANEISIVATLAARREAAVSPKIAAMISEMPLLTNRTVRQGDVIAVLESRDLAAQRREAASALQEAQSSATQANAQDQKALRDAKAALDNAERTYERRKTLYEQGGISKKELEASQLAVVNAQDDLHVAEAAAALHHGGPGGTNVSVQQTKVEQARSHMQTLDAQLGYSVIRAPFSGVVTQQFQYQGEMANPGGKLVTIADTSALIAKMQVGEDTATRLKAGDPVQVMPDDLPGQTFPGAINLVGRGADPQSRSVEVWVAVPNPTGQLRTNGVSKVVIAAQGVTNAVTVPDSAVTLAATNANAGTVMVVDDKSIAHEVHVTIGVRSGGHTQILAGLQGGETVVTEGNYALPDGAKVAVAGAEPPAAAAATAKDE